MEEELVEAFWNEIHRNAHILTGRSVSRKLVKVNGMNFHVFVFERVSVVAAVNFDQPPPYEEDN